MIAVSRAPSFSLRALPPFIHVQTDGNALRSELSNRNANMAPMQTAFINSPASVDANSYLNLDIGIAVLLMVASTNEQVRPMLNLPTPALAHAPCPVPRPRSCPRPSSSLSPSPFASPFLFPSPPKSPSPWSRSRPRLVPRPRSSCTQLSCEYDCKLSPSYRFRRHTTDPRNVYRPPPV